MFQFLIDLDVVFGSRYHLDANILHNTAKNLDVNCGPLSVSIFFSIAKLSTQCYILQYHKLSRLLFWDHSRELRVSISHHDDKLVSSRGVW